MAASASRIFDEILLQAVRSGRTGAEIIKSANWFRMKAKQAASKGVSNASLIKDASRKAPKQLLPGKMYFYQYDPKHKKTLPYYDRYPLIFMVGPAKGGFYGINMHYLPIQARAALMDNLFSIVSNKRFDENTRLKLSYGVLKRSRKFKQFTPCFKHYLTSHVKGNAVVIHPVEWSMALMLPIERFMKASKQKVYADSRAILKNL